MATRAPTPTASPEMIYEALAALIGVFAGVDPSRGWLYAAYYRLYRGSSGLLASTIVVMCCTLATTLLTTAPALIALRLHVYTRFLLLAYGANTLIHGVLKAAYPRAHYFGSLRPRLSRLLVWATLNATLSGYGLPLGSLILIQSGADAYFYGAYTLALLGVVAASAVVGVEHARTLTLNYDLLLSIIYVGVGAYSILYSLIMILP